MRNNQIQVLKRLKEEYQQQTQAHQKMIQDENEYYRNSKAMEIQRHNEAIVQMEKSQAERIQAVKQQEDEYIKQITEIRNKHAYEKKKIERNRQHELKMIEDSKFPIEQGRVEYEEPEMVPDAVYAEAVLTELLRLRNKSKNEFGEDKRSSVAQRIKTLSEAIDYHGKLLRSVLSNV